MAYQKLPNYFQGNDELVDFLISNGFKESFKDVTAPDRLFAVGGGLTRELLFTPGGAIALYTAKSGYICGPAIPTPALLFWMQQNPDLAGQREIMDALTRAQHFNRGY